jgi:hypothetical protein
MKRILIALLISGFLSVGAYQSTTSAFVDSNKFVRTASIFLMSGPVLDNNTKALSKFDLIVIPVEAQVYNESFFTKIRKMNSDIIILPYVATVSWNDAYWSDPLHTEMYKDIKQSWWLKSGNGNQVSVWPNTRALNLNSGWTDYLANHVKNDVLSTGLWDGVFYDEVQDSISWVGNTDVNNDDSIDSAQLADSLWQQNYKKLFESTRNLIGENTILITNGSSNPIFSPFVNGRMFETFPSSNNSNNEWKRKTTEYLSLESSTVYKPVNVINANSENTGNKSDYQAVRFGITTTLLGDGFFSYDFGTTNHAVIWEYDEFDAFLGEPKSGYLNVFNSNQTKIDIGVWKREFSKGTVIVNSTNESKTIYLDGDYEKLHGTQDVLVNDGSIISEVTIQPKDGIILLRPVEDIFDATYLNGAFARVFSNEGETRRTGFFAYNSEHRGGTQIISFDTDMDGKRETVLADDTFVYIYDDDGSLHAKFAPYTDKYDMGINISVGDIESDDSVEIVTGTENGGGPQVRVFNKDGVLINPGFFAYSEKFRGGVNVGIGDLNGDNIKEIITGAGVLGGPHVRVFKKDGTLINPGFFAYDPAFRGGVNVGIGDVDGDGIDDIVTGPGYGGKPLTRVYDRDGNLKSEFYAFDKNRRDGLDVVVSDVDLDGIAEIIGLTTDVFTLSNY